MDVVQLEVNISRHYLSKLLKYQFQKKVIDNVGRKWHAVGPVTMVLTQDQLSHLSKPSIPLQRSIKEDGETLHMTIFHPPDSRLAQHYAPC